MACMYRPSLQDHQHLDVDGFVQVPTSKLPPYRDVLEPLLPLDGAKPIHTRYFKGGQHIPTLSELLEAVMSQ